MVYVSGTIAVSTSAYVISADIISRKLVLATVYVSKLSNNGCIVPVDVSGLFAVYVVRLLIDDCIVPMGSARKEGPRSVVIAGSTSPSHS